MKKPGGTKWKKWQHGFLCSQYYLGYFKCILQEYSKKYYNISFPYINRWTSTPRYIQCNIIYEKKKKKFVQKRIQHGEWYNTTANCMLTDILSRMENAPSQPPSQPIHIARLRTTTPGTPETNRATRPTMHAKHNR